MRRARRLVVVVAVLGAAMTALVPTANAAPRSGLRVPTVTGPITTGGGVNLLGPNVSSLGYSEAEYFFGGDAASYKPIGKLGVDGKWKVKQSGTASYMTRMVVWRPSDPSKFDGTVYVEWINVSPGFDNPPDWLSAHNQIVREGAIWVGVSAQQAGVIGGKQRVSVAGAPPPGGLKGADPVRYAPLDHPGDAYSYDIFTQAGIAVRGDAKGVKPLEGYDTKAVIGMGESQSAFRLTTYVDAIHPIAKVYDGYLIHSRGADSAGFAQQELGQRAKGIPPVVHIRSDLGVPVLDFQTEGDIVVLGFGPATQPDSKRFRLWEAAGTSHADTYFVLALSDLGDGAAEANMLDPANATGGRLGCTTPNNAGGQHAVVMAALASLEKWVRDGTEPPHAPRLELNRKGEVVRDEHGIAKGGIRTPLVDVPIATNDGKKGSGSSFCFLFGHMTPFDAATIAQLYPGGTAEYVQKFDASADTTVQAGFWLQPESDKYKAAAQKIKFG